MKRNQPIILEGNYNFKASQEKWQESWQKKEVYRYDRYLERNRTFVVDTPPPTVSGQLHIGHVYSYTQTDFIVRFKRQNGMNVFYPIGFDDNGLPTERLVEKTKNVKATNMPRPEFIKLCKEVVQTEEQKFRNLFNSIALSVDWNLEYQTISPLSRQISQMSFLDLVKKGEIYRAKEPILWDPIDQTALAQADIEDKEKPAVMYNLTFDCTNDEKLTIATTRPELLPACMAVLYNPNDLRYRHLRGNFAITPLFNFRVPIIADPLVQINKGTGLVMCCSFGDMTDIIWWRKHKLEANIIISETGRLTNLGHINTIFQKQLDGLTVKAARQKIVELLKDAGDIKKEEEIIHTVKCAERSGAPLEIIMKKQWFVHTLKHKAALMQKAQKINWYPEHMKHRLLNWIENIAWDWCISRQRFFGVPFPVWYSKKPGEEGKLLLPENNKLPIDPLVDLPTGYKRHEVVADEDVMDTWATSSVSPQLTSHAITPNYGVDTAKHQRLFPFDLRPQAHEIIRTWTFYTILKAYLHQNTVPWNNIMISGWCLADDRSKMSKSKGNIIVPEKLLEQYGADVVRYWAASSRLGADIVFSEEILKNGKRLCNKLWNAAKFVSPHLYKITPLHRHNAMDFSQKIFCSFDRWLINHRNHLIKTVNEAFNQYEYAVALNAIEHFFWQIFCDNYLEIVKARIYDENPKRKRHVYSAVLSVYHTIEALLQLLAPFLPYITEEIYQTIYFPKKSIHSNGLWPKKMAQTSLHNQEEVDQALNILTLVRKYKSQYNLSVKAPIKTIEVQIKIIKARIKKPTSDIITDLSSVTNSQEITFVENFSNSGEVIENEQLAINIMI